MTGILDQLQLTGAQADAATIFDTALVVTAGAGSGKTRTLAARFVALLEAGYPLRSLVAITFTDKAAREMRSRIRRLIVGWLAQCDPAGCAYWQEILAGLDAARIGTIHSLCAGLLRAHPAEVGVDPAFDVLDENTSAVLRARALESAMAWAANDAQASALFGPWTEFQLREVLAALLDGRLEAEAAFKALGDAPLSVWGAALRGWLDSALSAPAWRNPLSALAEIQAHRDDDRMEQARREVLDRWANAQMALEAADWDTALGELAELRQAIVSGGAKTAWDPDALAGAREAMASLRDYFNDHLAPLADRKKPLRWTIDEQAAVLSPLLQSAFVRAVGDYRRAKEERNALDFDDLESLAAGLLRDNVAVRTRRQEEIRAVLVDEFQDTNTRQRQIVYALSGFPAPSGSQKPDGLAGSLFVVGDAKQSIYRFRGADVAVFRTVQADVAAAQGRQIDLDLTFRAHRPLVQALNALLAPILGDADDADRPFQVPFAPLQAFRDQARPGVREPFVEFHLGLGNNAEEGRQAAAQALAHRLREIGAEEGISWSGVALLFRASTGFPPYEDALEQAGIPFVTVAGRGFYERPEVRDLLNALAALADPTDDLALAGLLRSPAVGLSDAALYRLRFGHGGQRQSFWAALKDAPVALGSPEAEQAAFAWTLVTELMGLAGRVPVGELLKRLLDATHYRAALALAGGERLLRNVDKLLHDAHRSGQVSVSGFLEYVRTLRDVGAREGEAPTEAEGAVQLMTVHKAKGLEFPLIVIADAARGDRFGAPPVAVEADWGVLPDLRDGDAHSVVHQLAVLRQAAMEEAESRRLLYVAATRAQEKLIVSGHAKISTAKGDPGRLLLDGWLAWLGEVVGLDAVRLDSMPTLPRVVELAQVCGPLACICHPLRPQPSPTTLEPKDQGAAPLGELVLLSGVIPAAGGDAADDKARERESDPPPRVWRVVPRAARPTSPAWVVGTLVHAALRRWRFPTEPDFEAFLRPHALDAGLTDPVEIQDAVRTVRRLLVRFSAHPLWAEMNTAERYHELPYVLDGERGVLDLLYRENGRWTLAEFKTDRLADLGTLQQQIREERYDVQMARYIQAVERLLGEQPRALLIFLNVGGAIQVIEGESTTF
ncbi:MAG: UvrD-helicase domain-containing protein [Anaerolineae bacterium]|nr:UvrD-helicase domain-containing protein [Anaerolineae bacterium]